MELSRTKDGSMNLKLIRGGLSVQDDKEAMDKLAAKMSLIVKMFDLYNESDWQVEEVANWLEYEKKIALLQAKLYTGEREQ
jgi:hypothetical protein